MQDVQVVELELKLLDWQHLEEHLHHHLQLQKNIMALVGQLEEQQILQDLVWQVLVLKQQQSDQVDIILQVHQHLILQLQKNMMDLVGQARVI